MYRFTTLFLFLLLFVAQTGITQDNLISISTYGIVELPADIIQFNINLNAEADSPEKVYELHKKREKVLVRALGKHQIREEDIRFQPIAIQKVRTGQYNSPGNEIALYRTDQQVSLRMSDFGAYEQIQITLIKNGFDSFNGSFSSSELEEGQDEALRKAVRNAREKAELIANEAGEKLGSIKQIRYGQKQMYPVSQAESRAMMTSDQPGLMDFEQSVIVRAEVDIDFYIE